MTLAARDTPYHSRAAGPDAGAVIVIDATFGLIQHVAQVGAQGIPHGGGTRGQVDGDDTTVVPENGGRKKYNPKGKCESAMEHLVKCFEN